MRLNIVMFINVRLLFLFEISVRRIWNDQEFSLFFFLLGSWHHAFDVLSSVSIVTNTALIAMLPSVREYFSSYSTAEYILLFVAAEVKNSTEIELFIDDFSFSTFS